MHTNNYPPINTIKKIFVTLFLFSGLFFSPLTCFAQSQIVLFCSSWNSKCRDAKQACQASAQSLGIGFSEFDVDQYSSIQQARSLGVSVPPSIPYIYVLNNSKKVVSSIIYRGESSDALKDQVSKALGL